MDRIKVPYPTNWLKDQFGNDMSAIEAVYKLTKLYNDIAKDIFDIRYDEVGRTLIIKEREVASHE